MHPGGWQGNKVLANLDCSKLTIFMNQAHSGLNAVQLAAATLIQLALEAAERLGQVGVLSMGAPDKTQADKDCSPDDPEKASTSHCITAPHQLE
jgi:hypothetical protein